jgi:hypothetical protein
MGEDSPPGRISQGGERSVCEQLNLTISLNI